MPDPNQEPPPITAADSDLSPIAWDEDGAPRSSRFDDVYFSKADGLAESRAVFLAGCGLPDAWRGLGVGSALLQTAETEARARGCRGAHVDSFSFQAVPFYQKCGFSPFGILEDFPPGHRQFFMSKRLALPTT